MQCQYCSAEVPANQAICPECYSTIGRSEGVGPSVNKVRKGLMIFFSDPIHADWFQGRVTKYVPDRVGWTFYAETPDAFTVITQRSAGSWGLFIVDDDVAKKYEDLINQFIQENPGIVIGVQYDFEAKLPIDAPLKDAIIFRRPSDIVPWLQIMHTLLDMVKNT